MTGVIVKKDAKNLTIKSDQFGEITTAWDQVDSIKTDKPVTVVLQDGRTVQGTVTTSNGQVDVAAPAEPSPSLRLRLPRFAVRMNSVLTSVCSTLDWENSGLERRVWVSPVPAATPGP